MTREEALKKAINIVAYYEAHFAKSKEAREDAANIIEVLEQEPKTGHWKAKSFHELFCDNCGFDFDIMRNDFIDKMNYCPNCGAKMVDPQERSGEE